MAEFIRWLFSENNSSLEIGLFDIWHFLYLFIIFGATALLTYLFYKKSREEKQKLLRLFAYLTIGFYIADFFLMPLSDSYNGIASHKLPFHICTLMGVMTPFAQFNRRFEKVKSAIVVLGMAGSVMWMCYPGSALGGQPPFCYLIFQTFMYHGVLFIWGTLNLTLGEVKLEFKKIWKEFVGILIILVWAAFGNAVYPGEDNWFFLEQALFPFLTDEIMPLMVVLSVFGVCVALHTIYCFAARAVEKRNKNKLPG